MDSNMGSWPGRKELPKALCNRDSVDLHGFIFAVEFRNLVSLVCYNGKLQEIAYFKKVKII